MRSRSRWPAPKINCQQTPKTGHRHSLHAVVAGAVVASALVGLLGTGLNEALPAAATAVPAATSTAVQEVQVPAADLESVGIPGGVSPLVLLSRQPVLSVAGKVEVAYVGGGWCPYCALANWPLQVALSQFGTFTQLGGPLSSSPTRDYPGLKSWSFTGSHYVSKYFKLVAFEAPQYFVPPPMGLDALAEQYDRRPYTLQPGSIPFTDLGGHFLVIGALASVVPLFHLSLVQVAASLRHPDSAVARSVDGTADFIVAAMCLTPGASSASICVSKFARRLDARWAASFPPTATTTTTTTSTTSATRPTTSTSSTTTTTVPTATTSSTTTTTSATSASTTSTAQS